MNWDLATDVILISSIAVLAVFAFMGLCQLIKRKSLKKVDKPLLCMFVPLILILLTYIIFDKFLVINYSPSDPTKPSFPSSHVMATTTIFTCVALILPRYIKSKVVYFVLDFVMLAFIVLISIGRVTSGNHWLTDVIAALIFAAVYSVIYYLIIRKKPNV